MSLKRPLDSTPLDNRARKRRHCSSSLPTTPAVSHISLSTPLKTPHTPYPPRPFDSPGNPFGRKRIKHLIRTLPESTSFSKHLPLRFQFIRTGSASPRQGGVYRVVQVPLSYTFTHLCCLIAWLFGGLPSQEGADEHLFEVKKDASIYSHLYKPGQVKSGQTWVKLSSSQNPYRYRTDDLNDGEEDPQEDQLESDVKRALEEDEEESDDCEDEELEDWKWEDEEEFTVGHAWPKGPDLERAIIYHHSLTTQIHITINQTDIPRRKGRSNTPYVFSARGRVWLSPPPLPRPIFAVPAKKVASPGSKRAPSRGPEEEDTESDTEDDSEDEDDMHTEDINLELKADYWNKSTNTFAKFLARYMGIALPKSSSSSRASSSFDHDAEYLSEGDTLAYPSTPGLTRSSSVPSSPVPALATSSPPRASSYAPVGIASPSKSVLRDEGGYVTLTLPALTPFPTKARPIRKRMERIEKRMGKMKKGKWLCQNDDKDEDEKDELASDDDEDENTAPTKDKLSGKSSGARKEETVSLDWDPFGEEEEL
ncbi:hypothetical protein P691DRAFT_810954 [Macrolepiota fuliginosa MF-IS2]|uniref:Uncharacterized protein n=1 Tax=Macrolepiota fuliginosa MF-IS2 TaxID=1400762 RepID=A0A9P5XFV2_9AGAR|nr:hypothetical protein P691DRAFT_810954 [Macrolepiota fuliginosa MF-IS2]